jgi:hypothetical protein
MGAGKPDAGEVRASIVYWGAAGAGLTSNLAFVHRKLRREHRGDLVTHRTPAGAAWESLPVDLGVLRDQHTRLNISSAPGGEANREARARLLREADGVVFVADLRPERHDASVASLGELRELLRACGRLPGEVVLVVQYNHRDQADENALDSLHRRLGLASEASFEACASDGTGVLQTLTSTAKLILKRRRGGRRTGDTTYSLGADALVVGPADAEPVVMAQESAEFSGPLATADLADEPAKGLRLASAGPLELLGAELRIPIRVLDEESGREIALSLRVALEPS